MSTPQITLAPVAPRQPYNRWTEHELAVLRQHYASHGPTYVARQLVGRTKDQCASKAQSLGLAYDGAARPWTEAEIALLTSLYPSEGAEALATLLGHSAQSIRKQAQRLQLHCRKPNRGQAWAEQDLALLRKHYPAGMPIQELAALLGRKRSKVTSMIGKLGLRRPGTVDRKGVPCQPHRMWTAEEDATLRRLWPTATRAELLAAFPGRPAQSIWPHATRVLELELRPRSGGWTEAQKEAIRREYPVHGAAHVAALVGRTADAVLQEASKLGVKRCRKAMLQVAKDRPDAWTLSQDALLQEHYPAGMPVHRLAQLLGRTKTATLHRIATLKIYRTPQPKAPAAERTPKYRPAKRTAAPPVVKPAPVAKVAKAPKPVAVAKPAPVVRLGWTPEADAQLVTLFPDLELEQVAEQLGRSLHSVKVRAVELKLKKSEAYLAAQGAAQAEARLIKKKAKAQAEKKQKKEPAAAPKKWWQYHMSSPEYKAGLAATTAGRVPVSGIDAQGRPTTTWRKRETLSQAA